MYRQFVPQEVHQLFAHPCLSVLLCRYIYSVLPPGDEDLKGSEVQAITKFKRALGLDDVDAANMHMEVSPPGPTFCISYHLCHILILLTPSSMFLFYANIPFPLTLFGVLDWKTHIQREARNK